MRKPKPLVVDAKVWHQELWIPDPSAEQMKAVIRGWPDGPVEVEVRPHLETRTARANRYYWGVVLKMMAQEMGQSPEDVHEIEKLRHNGKWGTGIGGNEQFIPQSTATLDIDAFSQYLERVMLDGNEYLGIVFPPPRQAEEWRYENI